MLGAEFSLPVAKTREEEKAMREALRDTAVGGAVGVAEGLGVIDFLAGVPWLAREAAGQATMASLLQQRDRLERHTDRQTVDYLSRLDLRSKGALGDKRSKEKARKSQEKARNIIAGRSGTYDESVENLLENLGYEKTERSEIARQVAFWTTVGVDGAFLLNVIRKAAPKGYAFVRDALKNIGKNMDEADQAVMKTQKAFSEKTVDKPVPLLTDQRVDKVDEILKRMESSDPNLKTTLDATPGGPDYTKSGTIRKKRASEIDPEQLLKRTEKRNKKMAVEADKEAAKIKKEYADMGIEEFTENDKMFVTKPDGMTNEEALKKASEMYKRQIAAREKVGKKWNNLDIAKDEAAEYNRALKYWKDKRKKQSAAFQPSDKLNKALFEDYPEILTPQKREALAERFINNPEYRTLQKELKEAKRSVDERFMAGEIGEAEFHKQTVLLTDKTNKKTEKLLLDQIKSEVEFAVSSDPLKIYEDIVLKKGDYKDITRHLKGGSVQNSVDYALEQWS